MVFLKLLTVCFHKIGKDLFIEIVVEAFWGHGMENINYRLQVTFHVSHGIFKLIFRISSTENNVSNNVTHISNVHLYVLFSICFYLISHMSCIIKYSLKYFTITFKVLVLDCSYKKLKINQIYSNSGF